MSNRELELRQWVCDELGSQPALVSDTSLNWSCVSGDASFRKYYRVQCQTFDQSYIAVDAPSEHENLQSFLSVQAILSQQGIFVPEVFVVNHQQGFILLSDLGDTVLLDVLHAKQSVVGSVNPYATSLSLLKQCQQIPLQAYVDLPYYDDVILMRELRVFDEWCWRRLLNKQLDLPTCLMDSYDVLINDIRLQPKCFVHRDFHSRNIMQCSNGHLGLIDFQDAVRGPVTYDLVSLLRDAYISWQPDQVDHWVLEYQTTLQDEGLIDPIDPSCFLQWFDTMGLQRQLKVLGIFARLAIRDQKKNYLADMPRVLDYAIKASDRLAAINTGLNKGKILDQLRDLLIGIKPQIISIATDKIVL